jgi:hypothetical protein
LKYLKNLANGAKWFNVNGARTINNLALLVFGSFWKFLEEKYPYLSKTLLGKIADAKPKILIGQDNGILTVAREMLSPRSDGPVMTKTKLEWIIHGLVAGSRKEDLGIVNICCELHETVKYSL